MKCLTVDVTAEDIAAGIRSSGDRCALALAVRRHAPQVQVSGTELYTTRWGFRRTAGANYQMELTKDKGAPLTRRARRFVRHFDSGERVTPARFRLRVPE